MKPGLAILPLEVWADVSEHPLITRQVLAQIADNNGDWNFTAKLQKLLHGCGKQTLHYLDISSKKSDETTPEPEIESERRALLAVAPDFAGHISYMRDGLPTSKECEFPQTEMPENIMTFKGLSIRYLDNEVLAFLEKIKALFANVFLVIFSMQSTPNDMRIVFTQLLPMVGSIRGIHCDNDGIELLEREFPGTLALTEELDLFFPERASIPACLNWLSAPLDFNMFGPRLLRAYAEATTIFAIADAVRKQFLAATTSSAFVIFLQFMYAEQHHRADEFKIEKATTKEQLTIRNAIFKDKYGDDTHYVEVLQHPIGAEAKMQEWIEKRAYYEKIYEDDEPIKEILIWNPSIGRITEEAGDKSANVWDDDGPSTSAKGK